MLEKRALSLLPLMASFVLTDNEVFHSLVIFRPVILRYDDLRSIR